MKIRPNEIANTTVLAFCAVDTTRDAVGPYSGKAYVLVAVVGE